MIKCNCEYQLEFYHSTKERQHSFHIQKLFSSDTHQSMKTSDNGLKINRNIHPDAVTCDRMRPNWSHLGPIGCILSH